MTFRLAVSAEMVFVDLPFEERVRRISDAGFEVEIWNWTKKDVDALVRTGATFSSMTGYITGTLADAEGADELLRTAAESLEVAEKLDCPRLNLHGTGLDGQGLPVKPTEVVTPAMWLQAEKTLSRVAELGERAGRVFTLDNLNTAIDHPGTPFAKAADTLALVEAVESPHLKLNLDLYHAQIGEGKPRSRSREPHGAREEARGENASGGRLRAAASRISSTTSPIQPVARPTRAVSRLVAVSWA